VETSKKTLTLEDFTDLFKKAEDEIDTMLETGPWLRFLQTHEYKEMRNRNRKQRADSEDWAPDQPVSVITDVHKGLQLKKSSV